MFIVKVAKFKNPWIASCTYKHMEEMNLGNRTWEVVLVFKEQW